MNFYTESSNLLTYRMSCCIISYNGFNILPLILHYINQVNEESFKTSISISDVVARCF